MSIAPRTKVSDPGTLSHGAPTEARLNLRLLMRGGHVEVLVLPCGILILGIVFSVLSSNFLAPNNLLNIGTAAATLGIIAIGEAFVIVGGGFDLSVGAQVAVSGTAAALTMRASGSIGLGVIVGLVVGVVYGCVNGFLVAVLSVNSFITTLGTLVVGEGVALAISGAQPISELPNGLANFALGTPLGWSWSGWLLLLCFAGGAFVLHSTTFGIQLFATGNNSQAARLAGIRVPHIVFATFAASGLLAAIAGLAQTANLQAGQPTTDALLPLYGIAAAVLGGCSLSGGRGSMLGTLFGVVLIGVLQNGLSIVGVSAAYQDVAVGAVFLVAASSDYVRGRITRSSG
jgi:ribose transport system permease protein